MKGLLAFGISLIAPVLPVFASNMCTLKLPVNAVLPDGRTAGDLRLEHLALNTKEKLKLTSIVADSGPRRVLIVLDRGSRLNPDAKRAATQFARAIVESADANDQLALATADGEQVALDFSAGRDQVRSALDQLDAGVPKARHAQGVLAVLENASRWFGTPQSGDAAVVIAYGIERNSGADFQPVLRRMLQQRIRVFGLQLGEVIAGTMWSVYTGVQFNVSTALIPNDESLSALSWNTGGVTTLENGESVWTSYKLTKERVDSLRTRANTMYGAIKNFYDAEIEAEQPFRHHGEVSLSAAEAVHKKVPSLFIMAPHRLMCGAE